MKHLAFMLYGFCLYCLVLSFPILADVVISGPGLPPNVPLELVASSQGNLISVIYTFENTEDEIITFIPLIECASDRIVVAFFSSVMTIPQLQSRQIEVRFSATKEAKIGQGIECSITATTPQAIIFLTIISPQEVPKVGLFKVDVRLKPDNTSREAVPFLVDLESNLQLNATLSGMTLGSDLGWGITGLEFAILDLQASLGIVDLFDQFVFAAPFDFQNQVIANGEVTFVGKRVITTFNLFGLSVKNLAIFENIKFVHPFFDPLDALDAVQSPSFRFGDILTLSGETSLGLPLIFEIGFCADPESFNTIKKRSFAGKVCDQDLLTFDIAQLRIGPFDIGEININSSIKFRPDEFFSSSLSLKTKLFDSLNLRSVFDIDPSGVQIITTSASVFDLQQSLFIGFVFDEILKLKNIFSNFSYSLEDFRFRVSLNASSKGIDQFSLSGRTKLGMGQFGYRVSFSRSPQDFGLKFKNARFSWIQNYNPFQLSSQMSVTNRGVSNAQASMTFSF